MPQTIYWHDYETFGVNPSCDRPSQFAGVRTNIDLDIIGKPLMIYAQPIPDILPSIDACVLTQITPQKTLSEGLVEPEFMARIFEQFIQPQTCGAGYNSLRFDDEVTRYSLYRNFFPPYNREWQNGNSRWDIIDMVRLTYALRPKALNWPENEDGSPSFRLELLTAKNGLEHVAAHDALSDVIATINLAKKIKEAEPKLYDYCWNLRNKNQVSRLIDLENAKPLLHISSKISGKQGCTTIVMPLCTNPKNKNAVICVDLCLPSEALFNLSADEIKGRLYTRSEELLEGETRIPLKAVHINRCPILLPLKMLESENAERLGIDIKLAESRWQSIVQNRKTIIEKAMFAFDSEFEGSSDVDSALYQGFISNVDSRQAERVRLATPSQLGQQTFVFEDARMTELLFRYKARYFPQILSEQETHLWHEQVSDKFFSVVESSEGLKSSEFERYQQDLDQRLVLADSDAERHILVQLKSWADQLKANFGISQR